MRADPRFLLLLGCFLLSGMAGLVYQTAWTQQFALTFGASELAVVAVLAAYMAGLTAGAAAAARVLTRVRRPVLAYAACELGVAASALLVPAALRLAGRVQAAWLGEAGGLPEAGALATVVFHLAASFAILLVPTALMGATLPLLARYAVRSDDELGARVGTLYTVNTLGAAAGALLAGFALLPALGLGRTVWVAAALNAAAFLLAVPLLGARPAADVAPTDGRPALAHLYVLPLLLLGSAVSFTYEVTWTRLLTFVLGGSVYAFSTMLAAFLLGITLGAAVAARTGRTRDAARRGFVLAQAGTAVLSLLAFHAADRLPDLSARLAALRFDPLLAGGLVAAAVLLPGTTCIGATFPFAVRLLAGDAGDAGPAAARAFAWSTVGAVAGAVLGGLWLLPALQFAGTVRVLFVASVLLAIGAAVPAPRRSGLAGVAALCGLAIVLAPPRTPWNLLRQSNLPGELKGDVVFCAVGRGATVMLFDLGGEWRLAANGLPESAIQAPGARASRYGAAHWLALLAIAARPEARSLLVVGLGAGKTVEDVPPPVESIDVVELEPEMVRANRALSGHRRRDPLADPRVRLRLNDARSALALTGRRFDAIVSQPSHPWTAGAAHLYTREFFTLVRDRLTDDGVLVQWMGEQFVDEALLRALLATLADVFPHVEVYDPPPGGSLLFVASRQPLDVPASAARAIARAPATWAAQGMEDADDVRAARVQDDAGVRKVAAGAPLVTDQRNLLQTRSPRVLQSPLGAAGTDRVFGSYDPLRADAARATDARWVRRFLREGRPARARRLAAALPPGPARRVGLALIESAPARADQQLLDTLREDGSVEALRELLVRRADPLTRGDDPDGLLPRVEADAPGAAVLRGWRLARASRVADVALLEDALASVPRADPLYEPALRLRVAWRAAGGDRARAAEALALLDPWLAAGASPRDALLRARLARAAGDPSAVFASLLEVAEAADVFSDFQQAARDGLALLDGMSADERAGEPARLRDRLARLAQGGAR